MIHRVVFKQNTPSALGAGKADSYSTLLSTRGYLVKKTGSRNLSFGELLTEEGYELYVRYQSTLASNLKIDMQVVVNGDTYTIQSWEKIDQKNAMYRFDLTRQHE